MAEGVRGRVNTGGADVLGMNFEKTPGAVGGDELIERVGSMFECTR